MGASHTERDSVEADQNRLFKYSALRYLREAILLQEVKLAVVK